MGRARRLLSNTLIFGLGSLGSRVVGFLLVPLYTFVLSPAEYGTLDIVLTSVDLLLPLLFLAIYESVLRFIMDQKESREAVVSSALIATVLVSVTIIALALVAVLTIKAEPILIHASVVLGLQAVQSVLGAWVRAVGQVRVYALSGIIQSGVLASTNVYLLVVLNAGVRGYLLSMATSSVVAIGFFLWKSRVLKHVRMGSFDGTTLLRMLRFSMPLVPNAIMWWVMLGSGRYFMLRHDGVSLVGQFGIASRIAFALTIVSVVFGQAWQLSAYEEYGSQDRDKFYSTAYRLYASLLIVSVAAFLPVLKIAMRFLIAPDFYGAWQFVPFILVGMVFSNLSGFVGTVYTAFKKTSEIFSTSVVGGLLVVFLNLILVPFAGGVGSAIAFLCGFLLTWGLRVRHSRKFVSLRMNYRSFVLSLVGVGIQIAILFADFEVSGEILFSSIVFLVVLILNRSTLRGLANLRKARR